MKKGSNPPPPGSARPKPPTTLPPAMAEFKIGAGQVSIDHDREIPADKRTGSAAYSMALLCKQDKEQLDRIEALLIELLKKPA